MLLHYAVFDAVRAGLVALPFYVCPDSPLAYVLSECSLSQGLSNLILSNFLHHCDLGVRYQLLSRRTVWTTGKPQHPSAPVGRDCSLRTTVHPHFLSHFA